MLRVFTRGYVAVMTAGAIATDVGVVESGGYPSLGNMASIAGCNGLPSVTELL
jgi:hypothetical protein